MDPRDADELGNTTEPEEETFALQRKRSRRVSFADITSVHVFDRDEDFETPPEQKFGDELTESEKLDGSVGFQTDIGGSDDSKDSSRREDDREVEEEEEEDGRALFVQSMDYSSPGSVAGSLTSNDEENFFGPVSTKFIRSGRLSTESADSGNQKDVTLDSTAFSLHFRSLMPLSDRFSPSQHFLTPTKLPILLDEKMPTGESQSTNPGSLMVLMGKKPAALSFQDNESNKDAHLPQVKLRDVNRDITLSPLNKDVSLDGHLNHVNDEIEKTNYPLQSSPLPLARTPTIQIATSLQKSSASLKDGRHTPKFAVEPGCGNPLSVSSLQAKGRLRFYGSAVLSRNDFSSPPTKQHLSSLNKEDTRYSESLSSTRKKFLNFEVSGTEGIGIGSAKASFPGSALNASSFQDFLEKNAENLKLKQTVSVASLGVDNASDNADRNITPEVETDTTSMTKTSKESVILEHCGGSRSVSHEKASAIHAGALCSMENGSLTVDSSSIHEVSGLENIRHMQALKDPDSDKKVPLTPLPYFLPKLATPEFRMDTQIIGTPNEFIHSSVKMLRQKEPVLLGPKDTAFRILNQHDQLDDQHASPRLHREDIVKTTPLTPGTAGYSLSSTLCKKSIQQLSKSFVQADQPLLLGLQQTPEISRCYQTPLDHAVTVDLHSGCRERRVDAKIDLAMSGRSPFHKRELHASFIGSSAITLGMTSTALHPEEVNNNVQTIGGKDTYHIMGNDSPNAVHLKGPLSPKVIGILRSHDSNNSQQNLQNYKRSFSIYNVDSSGRKVSEDRALSELQSVDGQNSGKKRWKPLPQVEDGLIESASELNTVSHCEVGKVNCEQLINNWKDVCSRFSMTAGKFLQTSVDFLNPRELSKLQDRLSLWEEVKKYEKLCDEIKSQTVDSHGDQVQNEKATEARWLLHKLMYEQAKHCLLKLKLDRLQKSYQQLHSGLQECHALKDNFLQHQRGGTGDSQTRATWLASVSAESDSENQEVRHRVTVMRQELALLDESIKRKIATFHVSCDINGNKENDETILLVTDFVQKHTSRRNVLKYLQLWELEDTCNKDGQQSIILNYSGLLYQKFTASVSSIFLFNQWNDEKIKQNFPTVNACTVFAFVFGQKGVHMKCSPNSFRKQTQVTSFLLGNLLDVVNEVQQAQMEISNLAHASFHSSCSDLLQLHLCFIDFGIGRKVKVILDMTDLMHAVYPSEIDPSQLQIQFSGQQPPLIAEMADLACNLEAGHCMILRFCRHVSQLVKALRR
ncbi:uncharacterized protein [Aristolochia californica]|uniref:uncharacterized protein isoform X2 n=1 Tax=Aristolochia californica TaxID=171875 RepID=UPI0035DC4F3E